MGLLITGELRTSVINLIWRGFNSIYIMQELETKHDFLMSDRLVAQVRSEISDLHTTISKWRETLPAECRKHLLDGCEPRAIVDSIVEAAGDLVSRGDAWAFVRGQQAKIAEEERPALEAAEKAKSDAISAEAQRRIAEGQAMIENSPQWLKDHIERVRNGY